MVIDQCHYTMDEHQSATSLIKYHQQHEQVRSNYGSNLCLQPLLFWKQKQTHITGVKHRDTVFNVRFHSTVQICRRKRMKIIRSYCRSPKHTFHFQPSFQIDVRLISSNRFVYSFISHSNIQCGTKVTGHYMLNMFPLA